ncbi:disulfide oxidoreductase [Ferdinandcohnia sp. Marseille-Q9671]
MDTKKNEKVLETYLFIAFAAALISTLGSLYFSEIQKYIPCELCWYQRIFMYPLVIILGIAIYKKNYTIALYTFILSTVGGMISIYHYLVQKVPTIGENSLACGVVPCTGQYINWLGFVTIPFLALIGFTIIAITSFMTLRKLKEGK